MDNGNNNELTQPGIEKKDAPVHISVDGNRIGKAVALALDLQRKIVYVQKYVDIWDTNVVQSYLDAITVTVNKLNEELEKL